VAHDDPAADAVTGPGGTPPGPSAVRPGTDPNRHDEDGGTSAPDARLGDTSSTAESGDRSPSPADAALPPELAPAALTLFGDRLDLAAAYAELLVTDGVVRGLIGPREAPRIWDRHLLNCAAVAELIPANATVLDVGSGAGLPGMVLAIARPDLTVTLIEPLARRTSFLIEAVEQLGLTRSVRVFRGRADEAASGSADRDPISGDVVTARAVAPLDRLATWCLPLAVRGGRLLALKGSSATAEVEEHADVVARLGGGEATVRLCGVEVIDPPTTVVEIVRERIVGQPRPAASKRARAGRARRR